MSDEYKIGELLDITIKRVRVAQTGRCDELIAFEDVQGVQGLVSVRHPSVTVERVAPAEWPPRKGDLWRDGDNDLWFAVDDVNNIKLTCSGQAMVPPERVADKCGPLTLVHREEQPDRVPYRVTFEHDPTVPTASRRDAVVILHAADAEELADRILAHFCLPRGRYGVAVDLEQGGGEIIDGLAPYITFTVKQVGGEPA